MGISLAELLIVEFIVRLDIRLICAEHLLITCNFS